MAKELEITKYSINWKTASKILNFDVNYDDEEDILVMQSKKKRPAISIDCNGEYWVRVDPKTGEILGLEIEDFKSVFLKNHPELAKEQTKYVRPIVDLISIEMCPV